MFKFFKTAFFKPTHLKKEFQMKHLVLRAILKFCTTKKKFFKLGRIVVRLNKFS